MDDPDGEDDPLNIGTRVVRGSKPSPAPQFPPRQAPSGRRVRHNFSSSADLFSEETPIRKERSLLEISNKNRLTFESDMPADPVIAAPAHPLPTLPDLPEVVPRPIPRSPSLLDEFSTFILPETSIFPGARISVALRGTRRTLFLAHVDQTAKILSRHADRLGKHVSDRSEHMRHVDRIINDLRQLFRRGLESQRTTAAIHVIYHRTHMRIHERHAQAIQRHIERVSAFHDFLQLLIQQEADDEITLLPCLDVAAFDRTIAHVDCNTDKLDRRLVYLRAHLKDLVPQKPGSGDWEFNFLHAKSRTGRLIHRFEQRIHELSYDEVFTVIEHLNENGADGTGADHFREIEGLLFDLAWQRQDYPFGVTQSGSRALIHFDSEFFPAVLASTILDQEFAFTPFARLNCADWPFKSAVDMIFDMLILTNPFDIARVYWDVIQEVATSMHTILVSAGKNPDDITIDFDSLFPILIICLFAFGVDEWMRVAVYTISFNDQVGDDPHLQFAMTYLEGLVTQIIALDMGGLNRKAADMRTAIENGQPPA
jgi:hypothetical protein